MALKSITLENFRGKQNVTYNFSSGLNRIFGKNGVGKSTIKEAICFVFTGTDSVGTRNPTHLISDDQDATKVSVVTDKAEIVRTLTRKGNGTTKVVKNDVAISMTQSQLEQTLGSTDLFLSCFIPGFFLTLSTERQHKVIAEVRPPVNRDALFTELAGFELTSEEKLRYSLSRRSDLVASDVAKDRRENEKQAAVKQGEISQLENLKPIPMPTEGNGAQTIARMDILKRQWDDFRVKHRTYSNAVLAADRVRDENAKRLERAGEIKAQLATLSLKPKPDYSPIDIEVIRSKMLRHPSEPALMSVVDSETCPTCSQVVGLKHRERVKQQNEALMAKYHEEDSAVTAHNNQVHEEIRQAQIANEKAKKEYLDTMDSNNKTAALIQRLEIEFTQTDAVVLPAVPPAPEQPTEPFDDAAYAAAVREVDAYKASMAQYEYIKAQSDQAQAKIAEAQRVIASITERVNRLQRIEEALKQLPQKELEMQASNFELGNTKLLIGTEVTAFVDGKPYRILSTGTQMKTDVKIARQLDSMRAAPLGMLFLDNADLVDTIDLSSVQSFLAEVDENQSEVAIDNSTNSL